MMHGRQRIRRGFTLIELVIALVVLAALGAALASVFVEGPRASADPQIRAQARAIAEGYMEEILLKAYKEPEPGVSESGSAEGGETRSTYDDVCDYKAIGTEKPTDQNGPPPISTLTDYSVTINIDGTCNSGATTVHVTVGHTSSRVNYELVSQRADY